MHGITNNKEMSRVKDCYFVWVKILNRSYVFLCVTEGCFPGVEYCAVIDAAHTADKMRGVTL